MREKVRNFAEESSGSLVPHSSPGRPAHSDPVISISGPGSLGGGWG